MFKIVEFSHVLIEEYYKRNCNRYLTFIDATCGNGNDTLFLSKILNHRGKVIAYDIQEVAINNTKLLLKDNGYDNISYHLSSHENLIEDDFDLIIYNLGYLPGGNKTITTNVSSTINSIKRALSIIKNKTTDYLIVIVLYPGHKEGLEESIVIDDFCHNLASSNYLVTKYQNYNRPTSPYIITISKNIPLKHI